jgi:hypothetical protein
MSNPGAFPDLNNLQENIGGKVFPRGSVVSAYFSYLADELTDIEERLSEPDLAPHSAALRRAIARAFELACEADRAQRRSEDEETASSRLAEALRPKMDRAA